MTRQRFTMVEILVAITIVVIMAGSVLAIAPVVMRRAKESRAKGQIVTLEGAIENYKQDYGYYPADRGSANDYQLNAQAFYDGLVDQNSRAYIDWDTSGYARHAGGYRIDPWGNPYYYRKPGTHNGGSFDLWSAGPDGHTSGTADGDDDIGNW